GTRQQTLDDVGYTASESHSPIETKACIIQELRIEHVLLMESHDLTPRYNVSQQCVKCMRLDDVRGVAHERAGENILRGELVIEFGGDVILGCNLLTGEAKNSGVSIPE